MRKRNRSRFLILFTAGIVMLCGACNLAQKENRDEVVADITEYPVLSQEPARLEEPKPSESPTPTEEPKPSVLPTPTEKAEPSTIPTPTEEPEPSVLPTPTEEPKPSESPTPTEEPKPSVLPTPTEEPKPSVLPTPIEEAQITENSEFKIVLTAPTMVTVDVPFTLSVEAFQCAHMEWYINGEYAPGLEKQIDPEGTLQFSESGIQRITVIGYTEDWSEHVSDTKEIFVYKDVSQRNGNAKEHDRAMYSWSHDYIYEENEALMQKVMELMECNILYQEVSADAATSDVAAFLQRRGEHNQTVYYLCGDASWAIEPDAASMLKQVERAVAYNSAAGENKFIGIQFDVEPHCLEDFEANAGEYMARYVENCKRAYAAAHEAGLLVEICIPYWWDSTDGDLEMLEDLIANACDSVAVMNYYKKQKEAVHIETELELCQKYNKRIINITETIPPGQHELTEDNTYYNDGIEAIETMWNFLDGFFQYENLGYAYHYLDVVIELLSLE